MTRPTISVNFHPLFPPETLMEFARRAEKGGLDEIWLWDDAFLPGAFSAAGIALAATNTIKVGIGLLPAPVYNPLFAAMEITTLERAFPGRVLPGFGHGVGPWMKQIGALPRSPLTVLEETVTVVRRLLAGERFSFHGKTVYLDDGQMITRIPEVPPLYIGAMRERTLELAGRIGEGTIFTGLSGPSYIRWAQPYIQAGMAAAGRTHNQRVVYLNVKVNPDGAAARAAMRRGLTSYYPWSDILLAIPGIEEEVADFVAKHGVEGLATQMPDAWLDELAVSGTPEQVVAGIQRVVDAGVDTVVLQPMDGDPDGLDEYIRYLLPLLKG